MTDLAPDRAHSIERAYDASADSYHQKFRDYGPYRDKILELIAAVPSGGEVLDLGCGSGANARLMAEAGLRVTGYDASEKMLEIARRECPEGDFRRGDLRALPERRAFDAVVAAFCIVHFDDAEARAFLRRLPRWLNPGAVLYLSFMEGREPGWETPSFAGEPLFYNYFDREEVIDILSDAGLDLVSASTHPYPEPDGSTTTDVFLLFQKPA